MKPYHALVLVAAVLLIAGCVEEYVPENVTATQTQVTPEGTVTPAGPTAVPTLPPEEMAYISGIQCAMGDKWGSVYHCGGNVRIRSGSYDEVQVITMYPDNNTFSSGSVSLGGTEAVSKPFTTFPDPKYQGQVPRYFVKMDKKICPVTMSGDVGVAFSNMPVPPEIR